MDSLHKCYGIGVFPRLMVADVNDKDRHSPFILQPSLFHNNNVPPVIYFKANPTGDSKPPVGLPKNLQRVFRWKISTITPNSIRNCISFMKFDTIKESESATTSDSVNGFYVGSWCRHMLTDDFRVLQSWRKVNHYPGSFHLGRKDKLSLRLKQAQVKHGADKFGDFHPITFIMPQDYEQLCQYWDKNPTKLFIMKPPASARGNGIKVINHVSQIPPRALVESSSLKDSPNLTGKRSTMIVQEYIANPCLLENGRKFDLRVYVLLTSVDPLRVYVYEEGLVRFASTKYTIDEHGIIDQYMHLTNYFINKSNQDYQVNNDCDSVSGFKWTLSRFWRYLSEHYSHIVDVQQLQQNIKDIIIKTIVACEGPMARLSNQHCKNDYTSYELFGFDILLDDQFKPWILEVNITPSLKAESNLDKNVKYNVIQDMFNLVGYHLPPMQENRYGLSDDPATSRLFFNEKLYKDNITVEEMFKQCKHRKFFKDSLSQQASVQQNGSPAGNSNNPPSVLKYLTQNDLRVLMLSEDELSRRGRFNRVFPSPDSSKYLKLFDKVRYYNILLDAWEHKFADNRAKAVRTLSTHAKFLG